MSFAQQTAPGQQVVPQASGVGAWHWHMPPEHTWLAEQAWPQLPQLAALVEVFTQTPEQLTSPVVQHLPRLQVWLVVQDVVQVPQCRSSVWRFTHLGFAPEQKVAAGSQLHDPAVQGPRPHSTPQTPQFIASEETSTQVPEQFTVPAGQHLPALHVDPPPQTVPQAPQFDGSVSVFAHAPVQQVSPAAQAVVQLPQCCSSASKSTQRGLAVSQRVQPASQVQIWGVPPQVP